MRLLLTRPRDDAAETLAALEAAGHEVLSEPLLELRPQPAALPALAGMQALLITSRNGLRAFLAVSQDRSLPVYAVGPASAAAARAAGFARVRSAEGDAVALAALVRRELDPGAGPLLHPAGRETAGALSAELVATGFTLERVVLYAAEPVPALSPAARAALEQGTLDGVLLFSPRTAAVFARLIREAGSGQACAGLVAYCLSPAVAAAAAELPWRAVQTAAEPNQAALLALFGPAGTTPERQAEGEAMSDGSDQKGSDQMGGAGGENAAERVIGRFGGIRPMAAKLGVAVSTVQGWKQRGHIPPGRRAAIERAAAESGFALEPGELEAAVAPLPSPPAARAETPAEEETAEAGTSLETEMRAETPWRSVGSNGGVNGGGNGGDNGRSAPAEEPAAEPQPQSATPAGAAGGAARSSPVPAMLLGAVLLAAGALVAVLLRDLWQPSLEVQPPAVAVEALERRMARLEEQRVDASPEGLGALESGLEQLRARLDEADATFAELTADLAAEPAGDPAELESLRTVSERLAERLEVLEADLAEREEPPAGVAPERVASLEERLEALAGRIEAVAEAPAGADETTLARLEGLDGRLEGAAGRIEALEARLREALAEVEAARVRVGEETVLALGAGQLREALRTGSPYAAELEGLRRLAGRDEGLAGVLAELEPHAEAGVDSLAALQAAFPEAAARAVTAERAGAAEEDWQALFWNRFSDLVTVRAVGEPEGAGTEAVLARTERRLEAGDLAAALAELVALQGPAEAAMAEWRARVQARIEAEAALARLGRVALDRLGDGEG